ncbi:unnamed protein product [Arabidopsis arenosa]|uniref:Bifunctional inhibitor/plant lipid transfer protein/seed storage helical domain-containing protein n=1 Tax=Arabidopsis arenosa TaxID=38785 RepID=A0A8S1ZPA4_ARAAE|nr:unnamed protein product [Arabidopsis arenosa]
MLLGFGNSDLAQDREECTNQLIELSTCIPYVGGDAKAPTKDCCAGFGQVIRKSEKCVCILVRDKDDPQLGIKINASLAAHLPTACHVTAPNITDCISILHLPRNSTLAKEFESLGRIEENYNSTSPSNIHKDGTGGGKAESVKSNGWKKKSWLGCQPPMASSLLTLLCLVFLSLLCLSSSLNLRRPIFPQNNGLDLFSSRNLDRPSLAADDIHDLLPRFGFPKGLLPNNVKSYTLSDDGDFTVDLISSCYVKFSDQLVFYGKNIAGKLSYGSVKDVHGIQAKEAFLWLPITAMESDPSSATVVFSVGFVSKTLPASMFENVPSCSRNLNLQDS